MGDNVNMVSGSASPTVDVTTLLATPSSSLKIEGKKSGVVAKVPALIGKTIVQIYIEALAELEEPAMEITNIKHDLSLTGCEFIQVESAKNGKLMINGYIRESIDYTSAKVGEEGIVSIANKRKGLSIPFKCFTKFQLDSEPEASISNSLVNTEENANANAASANNIYYLNSNEELSYEVAETKIRQVNVKRNTESISINNYDEQVFSSLSICMAVDVVVMVLQNQYVEIPSNGKSDSNNSSGGNSKNNSSNGSSNNNKSGNGGNSKGNQKSGDKSKKTAWFKNFSSFSKMFG